MAKGLIIGLLILLLAWFATALIRVENERYALELEMCGELTPDMGMERARCLNEVETRTGQGWHLLYALGIL